MVKTTPILLIFVILIQLNACYLHAVTDNLDEIKRVMKETFGDTLDFDGKTLFYLVIAAQLFYMKCFMFLFHLLSRDGRRVCGRFIVIRLV